MKSLPPTKVLMLATKNILNFLAIYFFSYCFLSNFAAFYKKNQQEVKKKSTIFFDAVSTSWFIFELNFLNQLLGNLHRGRLSLLIIAAINSLTIGFSLSQDHKATPSFLRCC